MSESAIFQLTHGANAAMQRHERDIVEAPAAVRKAAREQALDHLTDVFLAMEFDRQRIAANNANQAEHEARQEALRVDRVKSAWATSSVASVEGLARFFCDCVGAAITACYPNGAIGTKAASRNAGEAISDLRNQKSAPLFSVQLPAGIIALRTDADTLAQLRLNWGLPLSTSWEIGGNVYTLLAGELRASVDCGKLAFLTTCKCGTSAVWGHKPGDTDLDGAARLPSLPGDIQDALKSTAAGSEKLLLAYLLK